MTTLKQSPERIISFLLLLCVTLLAACSGKTVPADYNVIPLPRSIELGTADDFTLSSGTRIVWAADDEDMRRNANFLADYISQATGLELEVAQAKPGHRQENAIILELDDSPESEGYRLEAGPGSIVISGGTPRGVFYGIQTLRKSIPARVKGNVTFPSVVIEDSPRFGYRGMHLDVARSFFTIDEVKKFIDLLPLHNLNVFHWHLTDDQGWRIQIDSYPELTATGAFRADTTASGIYGGFYTKDQIRDVVQYATERYITVIPEIDMPGHMMAALASYPELGCTGGPYRITSQPGVRRDILCAGNPEVYTFVEKVLEEVMELFPSQKIHIGGDEAPKHRWRECPKCQSMVRRLGLKERDGVSAEDQLQGYFNNHIEKYIEQHGRELIGWDEIVDGGLSPRATVQTWRGLEGGIRAARLGHDVIISPNSHLYFDYSQSVNVDTEPATIGGYVPLKKVYAFDPMPEGLTEIEEKHILGPQGNVWSPYMRENSTMEYMVLPRMAALSEIGWSSSDNKDFVNFMDRLDKLAQFYESGGYNYKKDFYDIQGTFVPDYDSRSVGMELSSLGTASIYYTLDGSNPSERSTPYNDKVSIPGSASVRAVAILPDGRHSEIFRNEVVFTKSTMRPLKLITKPHPRYAANVLNDGLRGKNVFTFGGWTGYQDDDLEVVIDMQETSDVSCVKFTSLLDYGSHIMDAAGARVWVSADDTNYTGVAGEEFAPVPYQAVKDIIPHSVCFEPVRARYVKVRINRSLELPQDYFNKTDRPFLFVDEIEVE